MCFVLRHAATFVVMDTALLKPHEVAQQLRVSRATVYRLIASGELATTGVGARNATRIEQAALNDYIARMRRTA